MLRKEHGENTILTFIGDPQIYVTSLLFLFTSEWKEITTRVDVIKPYSIGGTYIVQL